MGLQTGLPRVSPSDLHSALSSEPRLEPALSLRSVWLIGAVALLGYLVASAWKLTKNIYRQRPVTDGTVLNLLEDCKQAMGVFAPVSLLETTVVKSPGLLGFVRPRLLLPQGLVQSFPLAELRFIFLHELGHLKRGDILTSWLMVVPLVLHWFNPLVWYAVSRMRADAEAACDAAALSRLRDGENHPYGQAIIKLLERFSCQAIAPGLAGILESRSQMKRRIGMIGSFKRTARQPFLPAALFVCLALVALTDAQPQSTVETTNAAGEAGADGRWQPWVVASSPRPGETNVDPALTEITVKFDRDMSGGYSWIIRGPQYSAEVPKMPEGKKPFWRDRRTCVFPVSLQAGHYYRIGINENPRNFRGADGREAAQSVVYFTTRGAGDSVNAKLAKPKVASFAPGNGATGVDPALAEISVTFDMPMSLSYSWTGNGGSYPDAGAGGVHWLTDRTCVLPVSLKPEHQYCLGINSAVAANFQSASGGVPADPVEYTFKTGQ